MFQSTLILFFFILWSLKEIFCFHSIDDYGAIKNNPTDYASLVNSNALRTAFLFANNSTHGDRTVYIPSGSEYYFFFFSVDNLKDVTFFIDGNLKINDNIHNPVWPNSTKNHFSCMCFSSCINFEIKGNGKSIVDGLGYKWWVETIEHGHDRRPDLISVSESENVKIHSLYMLDSPKFHVYLRDNKNVEVYDLNIIVDVDGQKSLLKKHSLWNTKFDIPTFPLNTDGIDPSGIDYYIHDCYIQNFDDAVAVKGNKKSSVMSPCTQNVFVENMNVHYSVGMSIGSVPPDRNVRCIRNVTFENINFHEALKTVYIKTDPGDEGIGIIEDITYRNIFSKFPLWYPLWIGPQQQSQPHGYHTGCSFFYPIEEKCPTNKLVTIRNVLLQNITFEDGETLPGVLLGDPKNPIEGVVFDNVVNKGVFLISKNYVYKNVVNCTALGKTEPVPKGCGNQS